mmetsp:Transcript_51670/g.102729  ORF Transcript_51670/g.102729 Transcript_51670/m.102729 type:complete len:138 (+) Transcript_51670:71-484(+)|eukprot:CAMPEP_0172672522 /NCGR_PEP_ID=MMETSP1074-20121228/11599_1 /TAXON_ID=2916 /ORGANISM="Ceratium fusus, Strain PA161109" /LENGTH=137 /DNA_ID=CAMNT_0013489725 /DNA_START=65 /DNA_END=478 /DNA_ORIENTATION=+
MGFPATGMGRELSIFSGVLAGGVAGVFALRINGHTIWTILNAGQSEAVTIGRPVVAVDVVGAATLQAAPKTEFQEGSFGSTELVALIVAFVFLCLASCSYLHWEHRQKPVEKSVNNNKTSKQAKNAKKGPRRSSTAS